MALLALVFFQQHLIEGYINIIDNQDNVIDDLINVISLPENQTEKEHQGEEDGKNGIQESIIKKNKEKEPHRPIIRRKGQSFV
jgi:hypothetical protein